MSGPRPDRVVVVTGTGTEVGKTWVSCALLQAARAAGLTVAARKPAQSFAAADRPETTDAALLGAASGEPAARVCPPELSYAVPMAPPMAAEVLGRPVPALDDLVRSVSSSWPAGCRLGLVEGAGGLASPLAADGDTADLARALGADVVVLVADAGLGVIHSCRLAVGALSGLRTVVHLNRFEPGDDLHERNAGWLRTREGMKISTGVAETLALVANA